MDNTDISENLFSKLGTTYNEFSETVLTAETTGLELYFGISFAQKFVVYCPG